MVAAVVFILSSSVSSASTLPHPLTGVPWDSTAPFVNTGLVRQDESPEDIVMRAHQRDPNAMALVSAGYAWGICGFPRDARLASSWAGQLILSGNTAAAAFSGAQIWSSRRPTSMTLGEKLAEYALARDYAHADAFKKAHIFDLAMLAPHLEAEKKHFPNWEKDFKTRTALFEKTNAAVNAAMTTMRALTSRPATLEEQKSIQETAKDIPVDSLLFYSATSHAPIAGGSPDWRPERLLAFVIAQTTSNAPTSQTVLPEFADLVKAAGDAAATVAMPQSAVKNLIALAHGGDVDAMQKLANLYDNGAPGIIKDRNLATQRHIHAALHGESKPALAAAIRLLADGYAPSAWALATLAQKDSEADTPTYKLAADLAARIDAAMGKDTRLERERLVMQYRQESLNILRWRIGEQP